AQRVELRGGLAGTAPAEQVRVLERDHLLHQRRERLRPGGLERRPDRRIGALDADREQGGMLEREATEHQSRLDQVLARVRTAFERLETLTEQLERPRPERREEAFLGPEEAVDGPRGRTGVL